MTGRAENPIIKTACWFPISIIHLPEELIAQEPLSDRAASRLLHLNRGAEEMRDAQFRDFPGLLRADDLVVFNNTRVFPARLYGRRSGVKGAARSVRGIRLRAIFCGAGSKSS